MFKPRILQVLATTALLSLLGCGTSYGFCDAGDGEVRFDILGAPSELEGRWEKVEHSGEGAPAEASFDEDGRLRVLRLTGWDLEEAYDREYTFGCGDDTYPVSYPLVVGGENWTDGHTWNDGREGFTLLEAVEGDDSMVLTYSNDHGDTEMNTTTWWYQITLTRLPDGLLSIRKVLSFHGPDEFEEGYEIILAHS